MSQSRTSPRAVSDKLSQRDRHVVELVARFRQMSARQIGELLFTGLASKTPLDRSLRRLCERGLLSRLPMRSIGGEGGGSSQYVYQIGRAGWRLLDLPGKYWVYRAVNHHGLELSELYVQLRSLERRGDVHLIRFDREQEAWRDVGEIRLTPDAYLELGYSASSTKVAYFVELDRGTENINQLKEKCVRYWRAYQQWGGKVFPYVLFVVSDAARVREVTMLVERGPAGIQTIVHVCLHAEIAAFLQYMARPSGRWPA